jgi:hypothetical protein
MYRIVLAVLSPDCHVLVVPCGLFCPGGPVQILPELSVSGRPDIPLLLWLSCPGCLVPYDGSVLVMCVLCRL